MRWDDRVYGEVAVEDPGILALVECPTFRRLKGILQAGPSAFAYPFKTVSRYEHCLGVFLLLKRLGASRQEQVAGLLHDISHTAFSHAVDFVVWSEEQDHHEALKPEFLNRPDIVAALDALGYASKDFYDDSIYSLLEKPLPWLCADRLDYFLRDGRACGVLTPADVLRILADITVFNGTLVFNDVRIARRAAELFSEMNRDWWASPSESYIYNEFADALLEGFRLGSLTKLDLYEDDAHVLKCLTGAKSPLIDAKLAGITGFKPEYLVGFVPRVIPKTRWLDPPVRVDSGWKRLSEVNLSDPIREPAARKG